MRPKRLRIVVSWPQLSRAEEATGNDVHWTVSAVDGSLDHGHHRYTRGLGAKSGEPLYRVSLPSCHGAPADAVRRWARGCTVRRQKGISKGITEAKKRAKGSRMTFRNPFTSLNLSPVGGIGLEPTTSTMSTNPGRFQCVSARPGESLVEPVFQGLN